MNFRDLDRSDAAFAREALNEIGADRRRLAARFTAETWWAAPAQALASAAVIASPAAGIGIPMAFVTALGTLALFGVEYLFRKRTGISTNQPAGPVSLAVLIALSVIIVAGTVVSIVFAVIGERGWIVTSASVGFVLMLVGVAIYDRAYARDLQRAS